MNLEDLGRRAVACKHWRWMPGMLSRRHTSQGFDLCRRHSEADCRPAPPTDEYPDLSDPATRGCLLHLVREAWPDEWNKHVVPVWNGCDAWSIGCLSQRTDGAWLLYLANQATGGPAALASSEAEALVMALEAAP